MSGTGDQLEGRMQRLFELKHLPRDQGGWAPLLQRQFHHFTPDDYYEAVVEGLVDADTEWLDVGGGWAVFPGNPKLSRMLADRCKRLVAVDPSPNVHDNQYAHQRYQGLLEEFNDNQQFTLATARMVVEHVASPEPFTQKLGQLIRPGGKVVVYTVNRWAPVTILSGCTPMWFHHFSKKLLWGGDKKDTFPVTYLMNTRSRLNKLFAAAGFREVKFLRLDDCRTLAGWKTTLVLELTIWKALRFLGIGYPESCLLGVYERT